MRYFISILLIFSTIFAKEQLVEQFLEKGFMYDHAYNGKWDDKEIILRRFTRTNKPDFKGEHISFIYDSNNNLIGLTKMLAKYEKKDKTYLSKEEAKKIALDFLKKYAHNLLNNYEILWIKPHDEILIKNGKQITISGLKVKCQNLNDKKYFWVIVNDNKEIMTYERDVIWNFLKFSRTTQKWLHDSWLKDNI